MIRPLLDPSAGPGAGVAGAETAAAGRWVIDADASSLRVSVTIGFVVTVTGRFTDVQGAFDLTDDRTGSTIRVTVQSDSLTSGNSHWDTVLVNAGVVDVAANPTLCFASTGIRTGRDGWLLTGLLTTAREVLPVQFDLRCVEEQADRVRFRATGAISAKDAVRLLSQPGFERLIGKNLKIDLLVEATPAR
ncbi:MAG: YceI family protein [Nakamurella sp.]